MVSSDHIMDREKASSSQVMCRTSSNYFIKQQGKVNRN